MSWYPNALLAKKDYVDKHKVERKTADQIKEAMRKTAKKISQEGLLEEEGADKSILETQNQD